MKRRYSLADALGGSDFNAFIICHHPVFNFLGNRRDKVGLCPEDRGKIGLEALAEGRR